MLGETKSVSFNGVRVAHQPHCVAGLVLWSDWLTQVRFHIFGGSFLFFFFKQDKEHEVGWVGAGEDLGGVRGWEIILYKILKYEIKIKFKQQ